MTAGAGNLRDGGLPAGRELAPPAPVLVALDDLGVIYELALQAVGQEPERRVVRGAEVKPLRAADEVRGSGYDGGAGLLDAEDALVDLVGATAVDSGGHVRALRARQEREVAVQREQVFEGDRVSRHLMVFRSSRAG